MLQTLAKSGTPEQAQYAVRAVQRMFGPDQEHSLDQILDQIMHDSLAVSRSFKAYCP